MATNQRIHTDTNSITRAASTVFFLLFQCSATEAPYEWNGSGKSPASLPTHIQRHPTPLLYVYVYIVAWRYNFLVQRELCDTWNKTMSFQPPADGSQKATGHRSVSMRRTQFFLFFFKHFLLFSLLFFLSSIPLSISSCQPFRGGIDQCDKSTTTDITVRTQQQPPPTTPCHWPVDNVCGIYERCRLFSCMTKRDRKVKPKKDENRTNKLQLVQPASYICIYIYVVCVLYIHTQSDTHTHTHQSLQVVRSTGFPLIGFTMQDTMQENGGVCQGKWGVKNRGKINPVLSSPSSFLS